MKNAVGKSHLFVTLEYIAQAPGECITKTNPGNTSVLSRRSTTQLCLLLTLLLLAIWRLFPMPPERDPFIGVGKDCEKVKVEVKGAKVLVDKQTKISNCMIHNSNKTQVEEDTLEVGGVQEVVDIKGNIMM